MSAPAPVAHPPGEWNSPLVDGGYTIESVSGTGGAITIIVAWGYGAHIKAGDLLAGSYKQLLADRFYEVVEIDYPLRRVPDRFRAVLRATSVQVPSA